MSPIHVFIEGAIGRWVWECRTDSGQILYGCYFDTREQAEHAALTGTGQVNDHTVYYWRPAWSKFGTEPETKPKTDYQCRCLAVPLPLAPYPTEPGAPLTWQEAQRRVDAGLGVETLETESRPEDGWRSMSSFQHGPAHFKTWTYRVPAVNEAATALTLEEMRQMSLSIGRLTQELREAKTELATTKTKLAAARCTLNTLRVKMRELVSL